MAKKSAQAANQEKETESTVTAQKKATPVAKATTGNKGAAKEKEAPKEPKVEKESAVAEPVQKKPAAKKEPAEKKLPEVKVAEPAPKAEKPAVKAKTAKVEAVPEKKAEPKKEKTKIAEPEIVAEKNIESTTKPAKKAKPVVSEEPKTPIKKEAATEKVKKEVAPEKVKKEAVAEKKVKDSKAADIDKKSAEKPVPAKSNTKPSGSSEANGDIKGAPDRKKVQKAPARPVTQLPVRPAPAPPPRPTAPPVNRNAEKKPAVIIAHRKLDSKLKNSKEAENTAMNYQPEVYRSILDEPETVKTSSYRYSDEDLAEFRELLVSRLDAARKELGFLQGLITRKDEAGTEDTENRFMNIEDGSGAMEREQLAQLASRQITFINHLEKAMIRIENKTYGVCRVTGKLIDKARLKAVPHATLSIEAKKMMAAK